MKNLVSKIITGIVIAAVVWFLYWIGAMWASILFLFFVVAIGTEKIQKLEKQNNFLAERVVAGQASQNLLNEKVDRLIERVGFVTEQAVEGKENVQ